MSSMTASTSGHRVPKALRGEVGEILAVTDTFCVDHLDAEYAELCRGLVARLSRKRPSPLLRGDLRIWAAGAIYAVGAINFLFDPSQRPHLSADELSRLLGVPKSTMAGKAGRIRDELGLDSLDLDFCRRELVESHPLAWLVQVNGMLVDARTLPVQVQREAHERGLIPEPAASRA